MDKDTEEEKFKCEWMVRPCMMYQTEYDDCKGIKSRFNQYFIFGKTLDCSQWHTDYLNCYQWQKYKSEEAYNKLIASEKRRRYARLQPHYENDVWEKREKPPENWNAPLPEWMQEKFKNTYLQIRNEDMKNGIERTMLDTKCTIL